MCCVSCMFLSMGPNDPFKKTHTLPRGKDRCLEISFRDKSELQTSSLSPYLETDFKTEPITGSNSPDLRRITSEQLHKSSRSRLMSVSAGSWLTRLKELNCLISPFLFNHQSPQALLSSVSRHPLILPSNM